MIDENRIIRMTFQEYCKRRSENDWPLWCNLEHAPLSNKEIRELQKETVKDYEEAEDDVKGFYAGKIFAYGDVLRETMQFKTMEEFRTWLSEEKEEEKKVCKICGATLLADELPGDTCVSCIFEAKEMKQ
jgi:hypothetical protein